LAYPSDRRPAHGRYNATGPDVRQLTRGSEGSLRAGRVAEGKAQVTQSLAGTDDLRRNDRIGERDGDRTGAGRDCRPSALVGQNELIA